MHARRTRLSVRSAADGLALASVVLSGTRLRLDDLPLDAPRIVHISGDQIVSIDVARAGARQLTVPLLLLPDAVDPIDVSVDGQSHSVAVDDGRVPRITVDVRRDATLAAWRPQSATPQRRRIVVWLSVAFAATLLLARLAPRRTWLAVAAVGVAWSIALGIAIGRRQTSFTRDDADGTRRLATLVAQTLRVPIRAGEPWVPIVTSVGQLRLLDPKIVVVGDQATLTLNLPANGRVILSR